MLKRAQLVTFCMVVESESLTAAAERLFCVPSNVTKKLKELEMACGVTLFDRERNRLSLTPEGRALYHKAKRFWLSKSGRERSLNRIRCRVN